LIIGLSILFLQTHKVGVIIGDGNLRPFSHKRPQCVKDVLVLTDAIPTPTIIYFSLEMHPV